MKETERKDTHQHTPPHGEREVKRVSGCQRKRGRERERNKIKNKVKEEKKAQRDAKKQTGAVRKVQRKDK